MKTTKTVKTTITIETTTAELKKNLALYQTDMIAELVSDFRAYDGGPVTFQSAAKVAAICFHKGKAFQDLIEKTGTPWLDAPLSPTGWANLVIEYPAILGIPAEDFTEDVKEVVLRLDRLTYDATEILHSI